MKLEGDGARQKLNQVLAIKQEENCFTTDITKKKRQEKLNGEYQETQIWQWDQQ